MDDIDKGCCIINHYLLLIFITLELDQGWVEALVTFVFIIIFLQTRNHI